MVCTTGEEGTEGVGNSGVLRGRGRGGRALKSTSKEEGLEMVCTEGEGLL